MRVRHDPLRACRSVELCTRPAARSVLPRKLTDVAPTRLKFRAAAPITGCYSPWMAKFLVRSFLSVACVVTFSVVGAAAQGAAAVGALQKQILSDPELAGQIHALVDDPAIREILSDPAVADALNRGDYGALMANPKIHQLADDPAMKSVTNDVLAK